MTDLFWGSKFDYDASGRYVEKNENKAFYKYLIVLSSGLSKMWGTKYVVVVMVVATVYLIVKETLTPTVCRIIISKIQQCLLNCLEFKQNVYFPTNLSLVFQPPLPSTVTNHSSNHPT